MNDQTWEQKFAEIARASGMDRLPQELRDQLMDAFNEHRRSRPTLIQRLIGTLSFDSFAQPLPQGTRESLTTDTRQLFYICELGDIALDIMPQDDALIVSGQLFLNEKAPAFNVTLSQANEVVASTTTKSHHSFRMVLQPGVFDLALANDTHAVSLKNVPLELVRG